MKTEEYLKKYQPNAFRLFENVLKKDIFFHAYLLSGPKNSSLHKVALFLAKSLLCNNSTFACGTCNTCTRVDKNIYGDLIILDAKNRTVKVNDIKEKIEKLFSQTASEKRGIKIYIINNIEYLSNQCLNVLLKFLEEPPALTYAIFTTENENSILPTILSRCQIVRFNNIEKHYLIEQANKENFSSDLLYYACLISNDFDEIKKLCENEMFFDIVESMKEFINRLVDKNNARYFLESNLLKKINSKETSYIFYDLLIALLNEALNASLNKELKFKNLEPIINILRSCIKDLRKCIFVALEDEYLIKHNININLLILHTFNALIY